MSRRMPIKSKSYNKKLFRRTAGAPSKKQPVGRPHQRGGWRM